MIRFLSFLLLLFVSVATPWWVFLAALTIHALYFTGLEILILTALLDAFFMFPGNQVPVYTIVAVGLLMLTIFVRPYLMMYNQTE